MIEEVKLKSDNLITYATFRIIQCKKCGSYVELIDKDVPCPECGNELKLAQSKLIFRRFRQ